MKRLSAALLCLVAATVAAAAPRPNIVLIMSDDMGYSDIGCYGGEISTPTLDGLAAEGLRFTQFYNTGRCCPTRASLLTGLYPHQAGVGHMLEERNLRGYSTGLNDRCRTIAEVLKPAGYRTYMSGKWHVTKTISPKGDQDKNNWPRQRGFDRFFGTIHGAGSFYDPNTLTVDNEYIVPEEGFYYTDAISDHASAFIREHKGDEPFFLYVAYTAAHWPMHAKPEDIAKYKGKYDGGYGPVRDARYARMKDMGLIKPEWELTPQAEVWREDEPFRSWEIRCMEVYAAMVDSMDQGIGQIVQSLKDSGQYDNTLVLFLQDNGGCAEGYGRSKTKRSHVKNPEVVLPMGKDELQTQMRPPRTRDGRAVWEGVGVMPGPADTDIGYGRGWANVSNTPFREYKHWVHEGGASTPLIAHWPRGIPSSRHGALEAQPGHLIDIMATCVDLAGATYPETVGGQTITPLEGFSLTPAFAGKDLGRTRPILFEHEGNRALRAGKWKLVARGPGGPWELYDIDADRSEMHDLAQAHPEHLAAMTKQWEEMARAADILPWPWKPAYGKKEGEVGSEKTHFEWPAGTVLAREDCPRTAGAKVDVVVDVVPASGDGVLIAQGGSSLGWSLYVHQGRLEWTMRNRGQTVVVTAPGGIPADAKTVGVSFGPAHTRLLVDGKVVASQKGPHRLLEMPLDGLEVGNDTGGLVGRYRASVPWPGTVKRAVLDLE